MKTASEEEAVYTLFFYFIKQRRKKPLLFPLKAEKGELYLPQQIAYNLVQKEKSHGNIKQAMYSDSGFAIET